MRLILFLQSIKTYQRNIAFLRSIQYFYLRGMIGA